MGRQEDQDMKTRQTVATSQIRAVSKRITAFAALLMAILIAPAFSNDASAQGNGGGGGGGGGGDGGNGGGYSLNYGNVPNAFTHANGPGQGQGRGRTIHQQDKAGACIGKKVECARP